MQYRRRALLLCVVGVTGCGEEVTTGDLVASDDAVIVVPPEPAAIDQGPVDPGSVAALDRPTTLRAFGDPTLPVEAKILVLSADGSEPELGAIQSILDYRGVPYDVFVAASEAPLDQSRLRSGDHGFYQATILTSSNLSGTLSSSEWAALADYELAFGIRRAVLAAAPDSALGWGSATTQNTSTTPLSVTCTSAGQAVFRDVKCSQAQSINGDTAYLSTPVAGASLTPLLRDAAGHALAAIYTATDGREQLQLLFRQSTSRMHSYEFLHGVLGWVTGGTYLGERRIEMGIQVDDFFLASDLYSGGTYRMTAADLQAARAWELSRRATPTTPAFRLTWAFNGSGADDGDGLTEEARAHTPDWHWVSHTWDHHHLDAADYALAYDELSRNLTRADELPLAGFDPTSFVSPNISGLVNPDVMQAAWDLGVRFTVTDTSKPGCNNPSPNTTFYNALQPGMLFIPRRPTNLFYNVSTPSQWVTEYNALLGRSYTYSQILDSESDVLLRYLLRGEADPWMFHQADVRAYDGVHSLLGDLVDATLTKLSARLQVPVLTPRMADNGARFARRVNFEGAGVRATLYRGRALVIDAGRAIDVPVTGVRGVDGESYGGDVIGLVHVVPGTSTCVPLDDAGVGCQPSPGRTGGDGAVRSLPVGYCDGTGTAGLPPPNTVTAIAKGATWKYWDRGGDLGTAWRARTYDDSGWSAGAGPIGYGDTFIRTSVSYGPSATSKYITTYVRKTFSVSDPSTVVGLKGDLMWDDGAVVYLNGTEIGRATMPTGAVTAATLATGHEGGTYTTLDWSASRGLLVAGTNTIAVEVHQSSGSSSDLAFDLGLVLETTSAPPPPPPPPPTGGVPRNASWSYWDNGGDLGSAWRTSTGGSGWDTGVGVFGYGETYLDTTVGYGPSSTSKYITTYFTTTFSVDDPSAVSSLTGEVMYDDGFVAYLNGVELGRVAMPTGTITASTLSSGHEANDVYETFDWSAARSALRAGTNVLAFEVHQAAASSSDLVFDAALDLGAGSPPPPPPPAGGISRNATWSYWDNGGDLGTAWRTSTGGVNWDSGAGILGYGETYIDTPVSFGPSATSKYTTTYFTHAFTVNDPSVVTTMKGEVMYDDGIVVYLNGTEVGRSSMPTGTIAASTLAIGHEANDVYQSFDWTAARSLLRPGTNVLAVEVHQASLDSSDLVFDLALDLE